MSPRQFMTGESGWVTVSGDGFASVRVDMDDSQASVVSRIEAISVGEQTVRSAAVQILNSRELRFRLPGLRPGSHPLVLRRADGATAEDQVGLKILSRGSGDRDAGAPEISIAASTSAFSRPRRLSEVSGREFEEDDPAVSADCLELYFSRVPRGEWIGDLYWSSRRTASDRWRQPQPVSELNTDADEATPWLSGDGLTLWFSSTRDPTGSAIHLWNTSRPNRDAQWSPPTQFMALDREEISISASLSDDQLELVFVSSGPVQHGLLYAFRPTLEEPWSMPRLLPDLGVTLSRTSTSLFGNELLFNSDRGGDDDIYLATREGPGAPFEDATPLAFLNSPADDFDATISASGQCLLFASNREGSSLIYEVARQRE